MSLRNLSLILLIYLVLIIGHFDFGWAGEPLALWESARPVCTAYGQVDQQNPIMASDGQGGYVIVFEDKRSGKTRLYGQRIDDGGQIKWGRDGQPVCEINSNQTTARIISCQDGSVIVVWQDDRAGNTDVYSQKIDSYGRLLWGSKGAAAVTEVGTQSFPDAAEDGAGGVIVCWQDMRGNNEDIYVQRIDSQGMALWKKDGIGITMLPATQWFPKIISDNSGGAVIAWSDRRSGNFDIYTQRINSEGKILWPSEGVIAAGTLYPEENTDLVCLNSGAFAFAYSIKGSGVFAQVLDNNGKSLLGEGKRVSFNFRSPGDPKIAAGEEKDFVIVWSDNYAGDSDIYTQRMDQAGNFLWGEGEFPVVKIRGRQENPKIFGCNPWIVSWLDSRSGRPEIFAQKIDKSGRLFFTENGKRLSVNQTDPQSFDFVVKQNGEAVFCFDDKRSGSYDIYAQKIDISGEAAWGYEAALVNDSRGKASQKNVCLISDNAGNYIFAFEDSRSGNSNIYLQKINTAGKNIWAQAGIAAAPVRAPQKNPQLISDGSGGAIVVWEDFRSPERPRIYAQRINGKPLWEKTGVPAAPNLSLSEQTDPQIVSDGKSGVILVWENYEGTYNAKDVFSQRLDQKGKRMWSDKGKIIYSGGSDQFSPKICPLNFVIVWADNRMDGRNSDIFAQRVNLSGKLLWDEDGVPVCEAPDVQIDPNIIKLGNCSIITWTDKGGGSFDIYAQKLDNQGNFQWVKDGVAVCQEARSQQDARMSMDISNNIILAWEDFRFGDWDICMQKLSQEGRLLWEGEGKVIARETGTQYSPRIIKLGNKNVVAWEDYRNGENYSIYLQKIGLSGERFYSPSGVLIESSKLGGRNPQLLTSNDGESFVAAWEDLRFGEPAIYAQRFKP